VAETLRFIVALIELEVVGCMDIENDSQLVRPIRFDQRRPLIGHHPGADEVVNAPGLEVLRGCHLLWLTVVLAFAGAWWLDRRAAARASSG